METSISQALDLADKKARYDERAKVLLSHKIILANIVKMIIPEFKHISVEEIKDKYINDSIKLDVESVDPDVEDIPSEKVGDTLMPLSQENNDINGGKIIFDVVFTINLPGKPDELNYVYINIEPQGDLEPEYPIVTKAIYYLSRMILCQEGAEFTDEDELKLNKCYSIWICPDFAEKGENSVTAFSLNKEDVIGKSPFHGESYDKMEAIICSFKKDATDPLLRFFNLLFSSDDLINRKKLLEEEYGIPMDIETK